MSGDNDNQSCSSNAVVDTSNTNQSSLSPPQPQMFKLNVDCFEHLFEWLSLKELLEFRRTCQRMKKVVDYYIKLNYPHLLRFNIFNRRCFLDMLNEHEHLNYFKWTKQLSIENVKLTGAAIESIKYVLNGLEELKLNGVHIDGDFYDVILKHCPLLRHLNVTTNNRHHPGTIIGTGNDWLHRQYPMLEHFEMHIGIDHEEPSMEPPQYTTELLAFFQQNQKIRIFSTDSGLIEKCQRLLLKSGLKFDRLDIYMDHRLHLVCNLANILYENKFYKHLHLYNNQNHLIRNEEHHLSAFNELEKLHLYDLPEDRPMPVVESIKELSIGWIDYLPMGAQPMGNIQMNILKMVAENFTNLRRVDMQAVYMRDIWSFVCHAPKLQQIRVVMIVRNDKPTVGDFIAMNEKRKKLVGARKVKILVDEQLFLEFKWANKINFSLIELKRTDMCYLNRNYHWM